MRIGEENWNVLALLFPTGWRQMAWQSRAVARLRGFPSPDVLLRMLMLHVARGYSLRETVVRAKLANWSVLSDRKPGVHTRSHSLSGTLPIFGRKRYSPDVLWLL